MNRETFSALLDHRVLVGDGGMATQLIELHGTDALGLSFDRSFSALCLEAPAMVREVHDQFVAAGADIIGTNTFGANAVQLAPFGLADHVGAINVAGARLAREAAGRARGHRPVLVAGSVGPAISTPSSGTPQRSPAVLYEEQIRALRRGGVDLLVLETFVDPGALAEALRAATRAAPDLAVVALVSVGAEGPWRAEGAVERVARDLLGLGACAVGANCSDGPTELIEVAERMARVEGARVCVLPNAGVPKRVDGRWAYPVSPREMAAAAAQYVRLGARMVGGCCGAGPEHIAAIRRLVPLGPSVGVQS